MRLPIGIQTFREIIEEDYIYVDKTKYALDLIKNYKYAFLSRPRRFGKSLFLDTLYEIFSGNKEVFKGLYIYEKYDFQKYPVIKIDWAGDFKSLESTKQVAINILKYNQKRLGIDCELPTDPSSCFDELIKLAYEKYQKKVVILIDEYDKPILDNMDNTKRALENRDFLRSLYIQLKANDRYIKFAFLTGISKFSKASIFSGLNQIEDISLTPEFGNICGYTQEELESYFSEMLKGANLQKIKEWYNGYNFLGDKVYNPFDILKFVKNNFLFRNYWWESGSPFALITLLKKKNYYLPTLENLKTDETLVNTFDIEDIQLESLLFQAGYLTIDKVEADEFEDRVFYLRVPNREVQISLNRLFIKYLTNELSIDTIKGIQKSLLYEKLDEFKETLISLFASIPYNNYTNNDISKYEGYWAGLVYCYLAGSGLKIIAEDVTNKGKIDLSIIFNDKVYILEFKIAQKTNSLSALAQIKEKRYYEKYKDKKVYLVGIIFSEEEKNITKFEWEELDD
jgi:hypothetical protein